MVEKLEISRSVEFCECGGEHPNIRHGKIEPFCAGRRHNVRRIPSQIEPAVLHRLRDETAHPGNAFLQDGAFG